MGLSKTLAPLAVAFSAIAGMANAEDTANDNFAFSCDTPDLSALSTPDLLDVIYPANVFITVSAEMTMPFGLTPENGETPMGRAPGQGLGSGFVIDPRGYIVTNAHVLESGSGSADGKAFTVTFYDPDATNYMGQEVRAELVGIDSSDAIDLAILRVDVDAPLRCVNIADSDEVRVGERTFALGNPMGHAFTYTEGVISHTRRSIGAPNRYHDYIQTDAAINRGNSGGGLYSLDGRIVGVNTAIISSSGDSAGIGLAIPSNIVAETAHTLITEGEIRRGWLGVQINEVDEQAAASLGATEGTGVLITAVDPSGPSFGELEESDIILSVNGNDVNTPLELIRQVSRVAPGEAAEFSVLRDGNIINLPIELGDRDAPAAAPTPAPTPSPHP